MELAHIKLSNLSVDRDKYFIDFYNGVMKFATPDFVIAKSIDEIEGIIFNSKDEHGRKVKCSAIIGLFRKIHHMVYSIGNHNSIESFIKRILKNKPRVQARPSHFGDEQPDIYGIGHFRWDWKAYTLSSDELNALRKYAGELQEETSNETTISYQFEKKTFNEKWNSDGLRNLYKITLSTPAGRASFDYWDSISNTKKKDNTLTIEYLKEAVEAIESDGQTGNMEFEDFCSDFGYDVDSRTAESCHKDCQITAQKLKDISWNKYKRKAKFSLK